MAKVKGSVLSKLESLVEKKVILKQKKKKAFTIKLDEDKYELLDKLSKATELSKTEIVEMALEEQKLFDEKAVNEIIKIAQGDDIITPVSSNENSSLNSQYRE